MKKKPKRYRTYPFHVIGTKKAKFDKDLQKGMETIEENGHFISDIKYSISEDQSTRTYGALVIFKKEVHEV